MTLPSTAQVLLLTKDSERRVVRICERVVFMLIIFMEVSKITYEMTNVGEGFGRSLHNFGEGKGVSHCYHLQLKLRFLHCQNPILITPSSERYRDQVSERNAMGDVVVVVVVVVVAIVLSSERTRRLSLQVFLSSVLFGSTCLLPKSKILMHTTFIPEMPYVYVSSSSLPSCSL